MTDQTVRIVARATALAIGGFLLSRALEGSGRQRETVRPLREPPRNTGRQAASPWAIPAGGWWSVLKRTYQAFSADRIMMVAAGVTYYALLAIFPALTALVSLYGLALDPATLTNHLDLLSGILPEGGYQVVSGQLERLGAQRGATLGLGFLIGLGLALWSANAGVKAMFEALNIAYDETEKRSFVRLTAVSLTFTLGGILLLIVALALVTALPIALGYLGLARNTETIISLARWPLLLVLTAFAISALYRFGPSREAAKWRWITPGSALAAVLWIAVSVLFSWYTSNFGSYNETYGTLGAVIGFMVWTWLSTAVILLGAELNAESERQTARDSTTGRPLPMGQRGAVVADQAAG